MRKLMRSIMNVFREDPRTIAALPVDSPEKEQARVALSHASDNLRDTLQELLNESNRLAFRPVYLVGDIKRK